MAIANSLSDFFSEDERLNKRLVDQGILTYSAERDVWIVGGTRWGVNINPYCARPHTPLEIAVHECGHVMMSLVTGLEFEYVEYSPDREVNGQVVCKATGLKDNPSREDRCLWAEKKVKIYAAGPIAASILQYGNHDSWEQCASDVVPLGYLEACYFYEEHMTWLVEGAHLNIKHYWHCVIALANELLVRRILSYDDCNDIADRTRGVHE